MNKKLIIAAALCLLPGVSFAQTEKKDSTVFTVVKENPITPVKDQNQSGTCWAYSSLGFLESELLRMGKGEHDLCESFLVYHTYMDRADKAIRTHGDVSFSQGGSFYDAIYCLKNYGIVPQDAMPAPGAPYGDSLFNFNQLSNVTTAYVEAIAKSNAKKINPVWKKDLNCMYENYFGKLPEKFTYKGKEYTPQSYAKSLGLNPDDYVSLTSFTHYPFYSKFIIEVQDNWRWAESYNLPLDEFMEVMDQAVRNGYSLHGVLTSAKRDSAAKASQPFPTRRLLPTRQALTLPAGLERTARVLLLQMPRAKRSSLRKCASWATTIGKLLTTTV